MAKRCPTCNSIYGDSIDRCPQDNSELEPFDSDRDPLIGDVIDGRFRLEELLGAGGMGRVYRGTQLSVDRDVAVKLLRGEAVPDRNMHERFIREARVISGFNHPNIVRLIDFGNDDDRESPYLVMELAGGVSLADLVRSGRLSVEFAVEIARQVCSGLLEAHSAGIVHRDLKPDNLHLIANSDGSFHVKILDFGIAFPQDSSKNLTGTGMMCGTAPYVSPEQARSEDLEGQADLYSLGVILFEMLSGVRPFQGESGFEIIMQQVNEPPPDLRQYLPPGEPPEKLVALVHELLEKEPRARPAGAGEARDRLEAVADEMGPTVRLDLGRSGVERFEPWIRPAVPEEAPIHGAETKAPENSGDRPGSGSGAGPDGERGPTGGERADGSSGGTGDSTKSPRGESDRPISPGRAGSEESADPPGSRPESAARPTNRERRESEPSSAADSGVRRLIGAVVALGVLAVLGSALVIWLRTRDSGNVAAAGGPDAGSVAGRTDASSAEQPPLEPVSAPLNEFAGRCVAIGSTETDFHTVYFYPEVGELIFRGDSMLRGSRLEIEGQRGNYIHFQYGAPAERTPAGGDSGELAEGRVRQSADKRFFEFDGAETFTCRRESYGAYYADLALDGVWKSGRGGRLLEFPEAGQEFVATGAEADSDAGTAETGFEYRLLDGDPESSEVLLAVRAPSLEEGWRRWRLRRDGERETITLDREPGAEEPTTREYRRPGSADEPDAPVPSDLESTDRSGAGPTAEGSSGDRDADSPSPGAESGGGERAAADPEESAAGGPSAAGGRSAGGSSNGPSDEIREAWRTRFEKIRQKCRSAIETMERNNRRYQKLVERDKMDRAEEFSETLQKQNKEAGRQIREAGREFSALIREMTRAGVRAGHIQKMSSQFSAACRNQ